MDSPSSEPDRPAKPRLVIRLEYGHTERGRWCDLCATSAGIRVELLSITAAGVQVVGWWEGCDRCDRT